MDPNTQTTPVSKAMLWIGWILTALPALLFLFSGAMKLAQPTDDVRKGFAHLGWPEDLAVVLGIVEVACTLIYLFPRTAVLGAILLTGYLGGAIATHVRIGEPIFLHIIIGLVVWGGLYLRDPRLRALVPLRS